MEGTKGGHSKGGVRQLSGRWLIVVAAIAAARQVRRRGAVLEEKECSRESSKGTYRAFGRDVAREGKEEKRAERHRAGIRFRENSGLERTLS